MSKNGLPAPLALTTAEPAGCFALEKALPWGRNRIEYEAFFDLQDLPGDCRILDCAGGPSSFAAEMAGLGYAVTAVDPLYAHEKDEIANRIEAARGVMMAGVRGNRERYRWEDYQSPETLEATRLSAMKFFLKDYEDGRAAGRYLAAALPQLPIPDGRFDLALVSHFLFAYSRQFDREFHLASLQELLRVAAEVRVFPLLDLAGHRSDHLEDLMRVLDSQGIRCQLCRVGYEFQKGGNEMLRVSR